MTLGIDPKNDYAFRCVFGSPYHTRVLMHMLNAVLQPPPEHRVVGVDILNPITEPVVLDDKLSICFVDALIFPRTEQYHLPFGLWEPQTQLTFSDHLTLHLFQLPNFIKTAEQLREPLDLWLYFLNNGMGLDPENLPEPLRFLELEEAMDILKNLTLEEIERQRYEQREKARRDALSWEKALEDAEQRAQQAEQRAQQVEQRAQQAEQRAQQAEQRAQQVEQRAAEGLIGQIRLCERFLERTPLSEEELQAMAVDQLEQLADQLQRQLPD